LYHPAFLAFQQLLLRELPSTGEATKAIYTAYQLCEHMGNSFADEPARSTKFDDIISDLFYGVVKKEEYFRSSTSQVRIDRTYYLGDFIVIVREDKNEFESGDAYLQSARSYDIVCEVMQRTKPDALRFGLPVFLLSMTGLF
jgi:hypothetical protein